MKRLASIFSAIALVGMSTVDANAGIVLGFKAGIGIVTQDIVSEIDDVGLDISSGVTPTFGGTIGYEIREKFVVGLMLEYQMTPVDAGLFGFETTWGDAHIFSVYPFFEWHFIGRSNRISPYLSLAAGMNFNSFDVDEQIKAVTSAFYGADYDVDVDDTFGFRLGFGADFFLTEGFAANLELGWKYNKGDAQETLNGINVTEGDFNASSFTFTGGFRYYF